MSASSKMSVRSDSFFILFKLLLWNSDICTEKRGLSVVFLALRDEPLPSTMDSSSRMFLD